MLIFHSFLYFCLLLIIVSAASVEFELYGKNFSFPVTQQNTFGTNGWRTLGRDARKTGRTAVAPLEVIYANPLWEFVVPGYTDDMKICGPSITADGAKSVFVLPQLDTFYVVNNTDGTAIVNITYSNNGRNQASGNASVCSWVALFSDDAYAVFATSYGSIKCVRVDDGGLRWEGPIYTHPSLYSSGVIDDATRVLFFSTSTSVVAVNIDQGIPSWKAEHLHNPSSPSIGHLTGRVYITQSNNGKKSGTEVTCLDPSNGHVIWSVDPFDTSPVSNLGPVTIGDQEELIFTSQSTVFLMDNTGTVRWRRSFLSNQNLSPLTAIDYNENAIVVLNSDKSQNIETKVVALSMIDGSEAWWHSMFLEDSYPFQVAVDGDSRVYVPSLDHLTVYWPHRAGAQIYAPNPFHGGVVIADDGAIYATSPPGITKLSGTAYGP